MKTTIDLPMEVVRALKLLAVQKDRKLQTVTTDCLAMSLRNPELAASPAVRRRVKLPLIECRHAAAPAQPLTPAKVAETLLQQEAGWLHEKTPRR